MANDLTQDPLKIDTTGTDFVCERIQAVKFDAAAGATCSILDGVTGHPIWSSFGGTPGPFDELNIHIPSGLIDVTISAGTLYIYRGSGPR